MRWKKHSADEIVAKLSSVKLWMADGLEFKEAVTRAGISQATYFRWRARYGRLDADQLSIIKRLETENSRLRRALSELEHGVDP